MMDKQKQIEEMAEIALKNTLTYTCAKQIAMNFYNAGYRKIPEGAVVLTREEYDEFLKTNNYLSDQLTLCHLQLKDMGLVRKETAEKFAERVKMAFYYEFDELIPSIMADKIDEICKEITEGKV